MAMAKISKWGVASDKDGPIQHALSRRPQLGVIKSLGGTSTRSTESASKKSEDENPSPQPPVQTTDNPLNQSEMESSIAHLTDGNTRETQKPQSGRRVPKKAAPKKAQVHDAEYDDFE
jgi:hypothetical protein